MSDSSSSSALDSTDPAATIGGHVPSQLLSLIGAPSFACLSLIATFLLIRYGKRYMLALPIGLLTMAGGFVVRYLRHDHLDSLNVYLLETLLILLSPCAYLAIDYILLSRLALSLGGEIASNCLLLPARHLTKIFVASDVLTFLIQAAGGAMTIQSSLASVGKAISISGLVLQLFSLCLYIVLLVSFGLRVRSRYPHFLSVQTKTGAPLDGWRVLWFAMLATCLGLLIRSVFRIAEYAQGPTGYLIQHEGWFYLLDSIPLFIACTLFVVVWPPLYIGEEEGEVGRLAFYGDKETEFRGVVPPRSFYKF